MGTYDANRAVNLEFPYSFQTSFSKVMHNRLGKRRFRYVYLSGRLVEQDQTKTLWLLPEARKIKVIHLLIYTDTTSGY